MEQLGADEAAKLGERYLASVQPHRRLATTRFLGKMGTNFALIGLIQLILPGARIIDVRRHPAVAGPARCEPWPGARRLSVGA